MLKLSIDLIKERLTVSSVVSKAVTLKKRGKDFWGLCPFHKEITPSFSVNDEKKFYHCFGCGAHGDIFTFLTELHSFTFLEALKTLASAANVALPESEASKKECESYEKIAQVLENSAKWFIENLHNKYKESILKPLTERISLKYIKKFNIGYAPANGLKEHLKNLKFTEEIINQAGLMDINKNDYFKDRIMFPIFNFSNKLVGFGGRVIDSKIIGIASYTVSPKYLNSKETVLFKKNEILYGIETAKKFCKESLIIVEGYMDVITLHQYEINNSVAILGTAFTVNHFNKIASITNNIIFCFDGDIAGQNATIRTIKTLLHILESDIKIKFILLEQCDPEDYLKSKGLLAFKKLIEESKVLSETLWSLLSQNNPLTTPENYLELETKIAEYTELIANKNLKKYYLDFFKKKIYQSRFKYKSNIRHKSNLKAHLDKKSPTTVELMLKLVIEYPQILDHIEIYEEFSVLEITDIMLRNIQQHIIEHYNNSKCISKTSLNDYFLQNNIDLKKIINIDPNIYSIIHEDAALLMWNKFVTNLEIETLKTEYHRLLKDVMNNTSTEEAIYKIAIRIKELQTSLENTNTQN